MAWTPPRTWSPGEFVTALMMNTHVRDNLLLLKTSISDDGLDWIGRWVRPVGDAVTVNTPLLDLAQAWNAGAVTFTALKLNVTNTASAAGSLLVDLQLGGTSVFSVSKLGVVAATGKIRVQNSAASYWQFDRDDSTGSLVISDSNDTAITSLASTGLVTLAGSAPELFSAVSFAMKSNGNITFGIDKDSNNTADGVGFFWTNDNATGIATMLGNGWFGIGADGQASTPSYALHVRASRATWSTYLQNDHATPYGVFVYYSASSPNTGDNAFINCADTTTVRARIMSNGGLHNYQANNANLSDADTKIFEPGRPNRRTHLDKICQIEFKMGKYKDSTRERPDLMWTAQQLALIDEDWVVTWQKEERDGTGVITRPKLLGTRDHVVFMTNVFATQELQAQYVRLDQAVADHEVRIKKLENKAA